MLRKTFTKPLFLLTFIIFSFSAEATTYYVSNSGNDANSGTSPSSPWRTINKVNSFKRFSPGDNILFNRGNTFYGGIIISNSGSSGNPITYGAYGSGAKPIITGFTSVTSWTNVGGNIWESTSSVSTLTTCYMVTVNSVNTPMGRYPNTGYFKFQSHNGNTSITSSSLNGSTNWTGASIAIKKQRWYIERGKITGQSGSTLTYTDGKQYVPQDGWGFFILNDPRTLDQQNEWYYNPSTKKLRIYSTGQPANVKLATVENTFDNSSNCKYITINNLAITGANSNLINSSYGQYATVTNCDLSFAGISGIDINSLAPTFIGNTINNTGYNGIYSHQNGVGGVIQNNVISNTGLIPGTPDTGGGAAIYSVSANTLIQGNVVDSSGWGGIVFYGNNSIAKNNFVNYSCLIKDDCAGIATHGGFTGQQIIGNIVLNSIGNWEGSSSTVTLLAHGIFLDDLSNSVTVSGNSVAGCGGVGYDFHRVTNININNNTAYNNGTKGNWMKGAIIFQCNANNPPFTGIKLNNNIFVARTTDQLAFFYYLNSTNKSDITQFGSADNNYFARPIDDDSSILVNTNYFDVKGWQSYSAQDAHSKGSPKKITNLNDLRFEYNATTSNKTIALGANYIDIKGTSYNGSITLAPFTSAVLIKNGALSTQATENLLPAVNPPNTVNGLDYNYYEASSYSVLPTFTSLTPAKTGSVTNFDISSANKSTSYSFNFTGYVNVPSDGQYTFYTTSDDGSSLYIDNVLVVNNDGLHGSTEKSGVIGLKAGKHAISVGYFQQSGGTALSVSYAGPGVSKQVIPGSALYRVSGTSLLPSVNPANTVNGLNYDYYEAVNYESLPSFASLKPVETGTIANFGTSMTNRSTSFSLNFTGYVNVPSDGQYTFYTTSDDGSNLYIDNVLVVNNDGIHPSSEKSGIIGLKAGKHAISVGYFQQSGGTVLSVSYAGPGVSKQVIPGSALYRVSETSLLPAVNPANTVNGLDYDYYEASSYSSLPSFSSLKPVKTGTTANINNSMANRSTAYSLNFTGYINVPSDGQYTFYTTSDDGSNLYIDNVLVVNNDGIHGSTDRSGIIGLKAGKHAISVGYFQQEGGTALSVSYAGPGISKQVIPGSALYRVSETSLLPAVNPANTVNGLDYDYYEAGSYSSLPSFSSLKPVKTGTTANINNSMANRSTAYSLNFTGYINVPSDGQYTFYTTSDDGSNLYIDNVLVVNNDGIHGSTDRSGIIGLKAGKHSISVGYFQQSGGTVLSVSYAGPGISKQAIPGSALYRVSETSLLPAVNPSGTVNGLNYNYYEASSYSSLPSFSSLKPVKTGTTANFGTSMASRSTAYSLNFTGYVNVPSDGQYTFYTTSDDGSNLYIDNVLVVNNDGIHGSTDRSGVIGLKAGKHAISVGYFQQSGGTVLSVSYAGPGISKQAIPGSALYRGSASSSQRLSATTNTTSITPDSSSLRVNQITNDAQVDNTPVEPGIKVYPNPFNSLLNINIEGLSGNKSQLLLFDGSGKMVWKQDVDNRFGSYHKVLNTSSFSNGIYILQLIQENKSSVIKLVKQP